VNKAGIYPWVRLSVSQSVKGETISTS
jgi:hypothetical protein